jgi:hypothetical protein
VIESSGEVSLRAVLLLAWLGVSFPAHAATRDGHEEGVEASGTAAEPTAEPAPLPLGPPIRQPDGTCLCECDCLLEPRFVPAESGDEDAGTSVAQGKNFRWTPYASPGASPELGALISAGALFSFSLDPTDPELPRSSITTAVTFSTTGALLVSVLPTFYLPEDKVRIMANIYFKDMPDNYWGVGFKEGAQTEMGADTTEYDRLWWQFNPRVVFQVKENVFVGGLIDLNQTSATNLNPKMANDPFVLADGTNNVNTGVGPIFQYDTRDFPQNAFSGMFLELKSTLYGSWVDDSDLYLTAQLDFRHYATIGDRPGSTLAWNARTYLEFFDAPWSELPLVGSPTDLRGYYWGRFRDQQATHLVVEYRYMLPTNNPARQYSRSGFVVWGGLGFVGDNFLEAPLLPNVGVGYRFEVQPRMNLRIDFGFGAFDSLGFYINFLEAF